MISDTHGLVRPEVFDALEGCDLLIHAGDVGGSDVLTELAAIAPVRAVYGNCDSPGEPGLAADLGLRIEGLTIHVSHGHGENSSTSGITNSQVVPPMCASRCVTVDGLMSFG